VKLRLKSLLKEILQEAPGRPEAPGPDNIHHFPHHGLYGRTGGLKPKTDKFGPYGDPSADIRAGEDAAEEAPDSEEELPESIEEFFKFTQSANDNTSFLRPPHQGSGFPAAYGKPLNSFGDYDPASNKKINKKREETISGRASQKVTKFNGGKEFAKKDLEFPLEDGSIKEFFLSEKTRADKEGVPEQNVFDAIQKYVSDSPTHFISFINVQKLGINPQSKYDTPIGIYSYPLTTEIFSQFKESRLPFAGGTKFFALFVPSDKGMHLNLKDVDESFLNQSIEKIMRLYPNVKRYKIDQAITEAKYSENMNASRFWNVTRIVDRKPAAWNKTLRNLGISSIVDPGLGVIHGLEPTQSVFLSIPATKVINIFDNPNKLVSSTRKINFHKLTRRDVEKMISGRGLSKFVLAYKTTDKEYIDYLSRSENPRIRFYLAQNPAVSQDILLKLSGDEYQDVRCAVAHNSKTPKLGLQNLASDKIVEIRIAVARNRSSSGDILTLLSNDRIIKIREDVAGNPSAPAEILLKLSKDKDFDVTTAALNNPNFPKNKQESLSFLFKEVIGGRERMERDENDYSTKQPYKSGLPGADKKDIYNSYERIDTFFRELDREEKNDADNKKLEKQIKDKELEEGLGSAYNKIMQRVMRSPQSDLGFFDILKRDNIYTITDPERENETKKKPKGFSAGKSRKNK
jgi:hypothetical protein